jgi:alkylated DNA repair dioxygenase AlkB
VSAGLSDAPSFERLELGDGCWIDVARGFVTDHREVYDALVERVSWSQNQVFRYERYHDEPRLTGWWSPRLDPPHPVVRDAQRSIQSRYGVRFDGCGFAYYRNERDSVAFHRDRDLRWLDDTVIALVSLGQRRPFLLRPRDHRFAHEVPNHGATHDLAPGEGDLVVMGGATQTAWEHSVPKVPRPLGGRVSLQWRWTSRTGRPVQGASYRAPRMFSR